MQEAKRSAIKGIVNESEHGKPRDFRAIFWTLDPAAMITGDEFAELMCITRSAFDFRLQMGKIIDPVIRENRCIRFRVGDVRSFLENLQQIPADPDRAPSKRAQRILAREAAGLPRRGRPRRPVPEMVAQ